jgi:prefoldin subunit 5
LKLQSLILLILISAAFIDCENSALLQMRRDNRVAEERIAVKSRQLEDLQAQQENLRRSKQALQADLADRKMTIGELDRSLKRLRVENERLVVETREQRQRKAALDRQFEAYQNQLDALDASGMSLDAKEKRLREMKETIKKYLQLDLVQ